MDQVTSDLSRMFDGRGIETQLELYSLKLTQNDKKLYAQMLSGDAEGHMEALSPPLTVTLTHSGSPELAVPKMVSRKVLCHLIATLNASFPDYDFTNSPATQFSREPYSLVVESINNTFQETAGEAFSPTVKRRMWQTIDEKIELADCGVYSYIPDNDSDPFVDEGNIWSFAYFFYNKKLNRMLFFSCRCHSDESVNNSRVMDDMVEDTVEPKAQFQMDEDHSPLFQPVSNQPRRVTDFVL
eukprot:Clim_evm46s44 gene=Clim_evmTU46s44